MVVPSPAEPDRGGSRLWRALDVRHDERGRVVWAGSLFFVLLAAASIGLNAADALFFLRYGVDTLPWMIMFSGVVVMVVTIAYAAGLTRVGARAWSWLVAVGLAMWLGVERVGVAMETPGIYPAIWLTGQVVVYVGFTLLWDVAGELADARQAKRLFPLFTSAGIAGAVVGNALTGPLANLMGTENLLIVQAVGLGVVGFVAKVTTHRFLRHTSAERSAVFEGLAAGFQQTVRSPLFRLVAGVGAALSVLFFMVFFPFSEVAAESFETEESLAAFLGLFSSLSTAATFSVSLLLANRLFTRIGVVAVLMVTAVIYVAGFSLWLISFGLFTATLFRGVQWVAVNALAGTAFSSLFNVVTGQARVQVRDFVSAVPVQIGTVIGGAVLILGSGLTRFAQTIVALVFAIALLALVVPMRRAYAGALVDAVRQGLSDVFTATLPGMQKPHHDADTLAALAAGVRDDDPARRRVTAAILCQIGGVAAESRLRTMLEDPDEGVRLEALGGLREIESASIESDALGLVGDPSHRVRRLAVSLLSRAHASSPPIQRALEDEDHEVRAHAARIVGGHRGRRVIESMVGADDGATVATALRCVVSQPDLALVDARAFVDHSDARVRAVAAELLAHRNDSVAHLRRLVDDNASSVREAAARALGSVDRSALHDVLEHGSVRAREAALQSLVTEDEYDEYLHAWAKSELDRAAELYGYRNAIAARSDGVSVAAEYLVRVLEKRERMVERWVLTALGTEETRLALPLIAEGAISGDPEVQAEALEAIESLADRSLARRFIALIEGRVETAPRYRLQALQDLTSDHQYWFRTLAARTLFDELLHDLDTTAELARVDESEVVRDAVPPFEVHVPLRAGMMTVVDKVLALQEASIFEHLDPEELEALAALGRERSYEPGALVYEVGSPGDELMVIVDGGGVVTVADGEEQRVVATPGRGEPVGELGVLRGAERMAEMRAGSAGLHAVVIGAEDFQQLLRELPEMATALMAKLAERIARTVDTEGQGDRAQPR